MINLLKGLVGEAAAPFLFLAVFLLIVGGALYLTPRLAKRWDELSKKRPGYFDGMLEQPPEPPREAEEGEKEESDV